MIIRRTVRSIQNIRVINSGQSKIRVTNKAAIPTVNARLHSTLNRSVNRESNKTNFIGLKTASLLGVGVGIALANTENEVSESNSFINKIRQLNNGDRKKYIEELSDRELRILIPNVSVLVQILKLQAHCHDANHRFGFELLQKLGSRFIYKIIDGVEDFVSISGYISRENKQKLWEGLGTANIMAILEKKSDIEFLLHQNVKDFIQLNDLLKNTHHFETVLGESYYKAIQNLIDKKMVDPEHPYDSNGLFAMLAEAKILNSINIEKLATESNIDKINKVQKIFYFMRDNQLFNQNNFNLIVNNSDRINDIFEMIKTFQIFYRETYYQGPWHDYSMGKYVLINTSDAPKYFGEQILKHIDHSKKIREGVNKHRSEFSRISTITTLNDIMSEVFLDNCLSNRPN